MARRGIVSLIVVLNLAAGFAAQNAPFSRLLITAQGAKAGQSLLFGVDTQTQQVRTLFDQLQGTLLDITMDRDNVGYTVAYRGPTETGLHFFSPMGSVANLVKTDRQRDPEATFLCANLTSEDMWVIGTSEAQTLGRLCTQDAEFTPFYEVQNFQDADVSRVVIERKSAKFILALNTIAGGVVYSYCLHEREIRTTLASGLGYITDLIQDPCTGGFLVSSRDRNAPILYIGPETSASKVTTFAIPANHFPGGLSVNAMALDTRMNPAGDHALWILASNRLFRITWNSFTRTIRFPATLQVIKLPVGNPTAMIFEGNRDHLLVGTVAKTLQEGSEAFLTLRLGQSYPDHLYIIAASLAMNPGIALAEGRMINLRADPLFFMSINGLLPTTVFDDMNGNTGTGGKVTGRVRARRDWVSILSGITFYFAGVVIDPAVPARVRTVTNTVGLTLF